MAGIYLSREFGWTKSRAKTSPYRARSSNPRSWLSVGDWHRISKASRILLLKLFSSLAMTASLLSSNLWPVSLRCSPTAESVDLVVLECSFNRTLRVGRFLNYRSFHNQHTLFVVDATPLSIGCGIFRMYKLWSEGVERYIVGVHTLLAEGARDFFRYTLHIGERDTRGALLLTCTHWSLALPLFLRNFCTSTLCSCCHGRRL